MPESFADPALLMGMQEWVALVILFAASFVEYVFPPFPGDTVTLAGAVLVASFGWSLPLVFLVTTGGSVAGAIVDFYVGVWWHRRRQRTGIRGDGRARRALERVVAGFRRHGEVYLIINRFLPGIRAFFFVAAGLAEMRPWRVFLFAAISAAAWNALIISAGLAIGSNLDALRDLFQTYSAVVWALICVVALFAAVRWWTRRRRRKSR